jgi:hypothetical protein
MSLSGDLPEGEHSGSNFESRLKAWSLNRSSQPEANMKPLFNSNTVQVENIPSLHAVTTCFENDEPPLQINLTVTKSLFAKQYSSQSGPAVYSSGAPFLRPT